MSAHSPQSRTSGHLISEYNFWTVFNNTVLAEYQSELLRLKGYAGRAETFQHLLTYCVRKKLPGSFFLCSCCNTVYSDMSQSAKKKK